MKINEIIESVHKWLEAKRIEYASEMRIEVAKDEDDCLRVFFETANCVSELIVHQPDCAPYRCVSFEVLKIKESINAKPIFAYYDNATDTIENIINQLNTGIKVANSN